MSFMKDNQSIYPDAPCIHDLPTWNVKNVHMKKRKCSSKYFLKKGTFGITNSDFFVHFNVCWLLLNATTMLRRHPSKKPLKVFNIHGNFLKELGSFCSFKSIFLDPQSYIFYSGAFSSGITKYHLFAGWSSTAWMNSQFDGFPFNSALFRLVISWPL